MSVKSLSDLFYFGADILKTRQSETDVLLGQIGSVTEEYVSGDEAEIWQHVGFASRPGLADKGKAAAQAIAIRHSECDAIIATRDTRAVKIYGNLKDGETCVYATGADGKSQARAIFKQDGSINLFTTDTNTDAGNSVYFRVAPNGFAWVAPWGTIKFDETGFHVRHASGARIDLGAMGGLPFPLDQLSSYVSMKAASINAKGSIVALGGDTGQAAVPHEGLLAFLGTMVAAITAIGAALAIDTGIPDPATKSAATAAASAVAPALLAAEATGLLKTSVTVA